MKNLFYRFVIIGLFLLLNMAETSADVVSFRDGFPAPFSGGTYTGAEDLMLVRNPNGAGEHHNFGARPFMQVGHVPFGGGTFDRHGLIRFDVRSLAGRYSSIDSITLRLFVSNMNAGLQRESDITGSGTLALYPLADANKNWEEGTGSFFNSNSPITPGMATWSQLVQGSVNWAGSPGASSVGVDHFAQMLASRSFDSADEAILEGRSFDLTFNDTSLIEEWITGNNAGLFLDTLSRNTNNSITFFTNDATNPIYVPELLISFTPVPEPSVGTLLISLLLYVGGRRKV